ncbi:MAG: sensor histidine kinase [Deltaproteobacteria bacterium]
MAESTHRASRDDSRRTLQAIGRRWIALLRAATVSVFFVIAVFASIKGLPQWRALLPVTAFYIVISIAAAAVSRVRGGIASGYAIPFADVPILYWLQHRALVAAATPAYVAGWAEGLFVYLVLASGLTFQPAVVWLSAATGAIAQMLLLTESHLTLDTLISSVTLLALSAFVSRFVARQIEDSATGLVEQETARLAAERRADALRIEREHARTFTDFMVHDLRQPLTGAIALVDVASRRAGPGAAPDLELASRELKRLQQMIADLVALSRIEQGVLQPRLADESVGPLLAALADAHRAEAETLGIGLEVDAPEGLHASVDAQLVARAVENLLANAFRHTPRGKRIRLSARRAGNRVVVAVENEGEPMPEEMKPQLFQKFTSGENSPHHAGIGLYFCRLVAEAHGGSAVLGEAAPLSVEFQLQFPASAPEAHPAA